MQIILSNTIEYS